MQFQPKTPTTKGPAEWFTGDVHFDVIARGEAPSRLRVNLVRFAPGARTAWHTHSMGQTLHVTDGIGLVQSRGGEVRVIRPGDTVYTPPANGTGTGHPPTRSCATSPCGRTTAPRGATTSPTRSTARPRSTSAADAPAASASDDGQEGTASHGVHTTRQLRPQGQPHRARLHELRRHRRAAHEWALDDEAAEPIFRQAVELGITFWDTANVYGCGTSEEIVGRAIKKYSRREDIVLATKVYFPMHDGPGGSGLSRKAIMEQIDASLTRLGTDYVDLYQIHRFDPRDAGRGDDGGAARRGEGRQGPLPRRLLDVGVAVRQACSTPPTLHGWTRFVSMQDQYSLLQREEEREMFGLLADQGVGSIPWSPLAKGRLARPWGEQTAALRERPDGPAVRRRRRPRPIVDAVEQVAEARGVPMAQVALAWVLRNPVVAAPIVGATKPHHLADAVAALDVAAHRRGDRGARGGRTRCGRRRGTERGGARRPVRSVSAPCSQPPSPACGQTLPAHGS